MGMRYTPQRIPVPDADEDALVPEHLWDALTRVDYLLSGSSGEDFSQRLSEFGARLSRVEEQGAPASSSGRVSVNATDFGAVFDRNTDDTVPLQRAADYVAEKGGGVVNLPAGGGIFTGLVLQSDVALVGAGREATVLKQKDGFIGHGIQAYKARDASEANGKRCRVAHFTLEGNRTAAAYGKNPEANGIHLENYDSGVKNAGDAEYDSKHVLEDITVKNFRGTGVMAYGTSGENLFFDVRCEYNNGEGLDTSFDSKYIGCTASHNYGAGFLVRRGSSSFTSCKSFFSGYRADMTGPNSGDSRTPKKSPGFSVTGSNLTMVGVLAQNNMGAGYYLRSDSSTIQGVADANNFRFDPYAALPLDDPANPGVVIDRSTGLIVDVVSRVTGRQFGSYWGRQGIALRIKDSSYCRVTMTHTPPGGYAGPDFIAKMTADSDPGNSSVVILSAAPDFPVR